MKHHCIKTIAALLAVLTLAVSATAQQANYIINGKNLPRQTKNGTVVRLLDRQTWDSIGCATVSKGKFTIEGKTDTVVMGWITDSRHLYFPVVIEPGMNVTLDARNYSISGSPLNDQLCRYTSGYSQYQKMLDDSYDVSSAVREGSWLYRKAQESIKICIDTINHFKNIMLSMHFQNSKQLVR